MIIAFDSNMYSLQLYCSVRWFRSTACDTGGCGVAHLACSRNRSSVLKARRVDQGRPLAVEQLLWAGTAGQLAATEGKSQCQGLLAGSPPASNRRDWQPTVERA